jgi:hypothetical protein
MKVGDCFTLEPCLVQGVNSKGFLWDDGWTLSTEVSMHARVGSALIICPEWSSISSVRTSAFDYGRWSRGIDEGLGIETGTGNWKVRGTLLGLPTL